MNPRRSACLIYAFAAALAVFCWQAATVHFNYGGNWTALFMNGELYKPPPELAPGTYVFCASRGYDGQFYRYLAHAPWIRTDWIPYFDSARLRCARILVPALAWFLAAGNQPWIDGVYIAVILGWIFLGVYWLALYASEEGYAPAWGLAFLLLPATLTSADRMTVDVAVAALCVAFVRISKRQPPGLYFLLVLAPLVRDTGAMLVAAQTGSELFQKRWRRAAVHASAILPALAWYFYVWLRVDAASTRRAGDNLHGLTEWLFKQPGAGIVLRLFRPVHYPFDALVNRTVQCADALALCAFLAILAAGLWYLRRFPWDAEQCAIASGIALVLATSTPIFFTNVYGYARPYSPLIFFVTLRLLRSRVAWALVPLSLLALRVCIQMMPQAIGIVRGVF